MDSRAGQNEVWEQIAKKVRFLLHNESITIKQMAERIGVELEFLQQVTDGLAKPTRHLLGKLCAAFNVKMEYFESEVLSLLGNGDDSEDADDEPEKLGTLPLPFTPSGQKRKALPVGTAPAADKSAAGGKKQKIQFHLAQMAAHQQALLECLIDKRLITPADYKKKLGIVRQRVKVAKTAAVGRK